MSREGGGNADTARPFISPDASLRKAAGLLIERDIGAVVVVDRANRLEGPLTARDLVQAVREGTASDAK